MAAMVGGMESEAKVREALALLSQTGRLDLLKEGALAPARRASAGVAAVVAACSPPRVVSGGKVRCASRGAGARGGPGAGPRRVYGRVRVGESLGVPRKPGCAERRPSCTSALKGTAGPRVEAGQQALEQGQLGALEASATKKGKGKVKAEGARQVRRGGSQIRKLKPSAAGGAAASAASSVTVAFPSGKQGKVGRGDGAHLGHGAWALFLGGGQHGVFQEKEAEGDPKVPLSIKWPTMLQWSSDEEGGELECDRCIEGGGSPVSSGGAPSLSLGAGILEGEVGGLDDGLLEEGLEEEEGFGAGGQWDISYSPGTPDLSWQGLLGYGEEDPGEQDAARFRIKKRGLVARS
ncbi:hypothetical protein NDU88_002526 [Pleurodeles waltl]|uniref:Uncharacterized protein n=1 Tax=Pleurodeles waltl TaxID=8319 RepID=A0AAV7PE98_PLEWA|nr:hypothetical protein NDU88_002526 [Pleurodeles waltl]